jgi:hypothetical protein
MTGRARARNRRRGRRARGVIRGSEEDAHGGKKNRGRGHGAVVDALRPPLRISRDNKEILSSPNSFIFKIKYRGNFSSSNPLHIHDSQIEMATRISPSGNGLPSPSPRGQKFPVPVPVPVGEFIPVGNPAGRDGNGYKPAGFCYPKLVPVKNIYTH